MFKYFFSLAILFLSSNQLLAQSCKIEGIVTDSSGQVIEGAVVISMNPIDSIMASFASTDDKGHFSLGKFKEDSLLIQVSFLGYAPHYQVIACEGSDFNLQVKMQVQEFMLAGATVTEERIPIGINGDTVQYDPRAFGVRPGDMTEDLLKKLPGIEVDQSGNITAMGKKVDKVLVDGKDFFGSNPKAATKNIPADAIKKIKVYDKKTDDEAYTKIDDGKESISIDLELKEGKKAGGFGEISLNGGTKSRYAAKGSYFKFGKKIKLALIGMSNNTNQTGYSFEELMSFNGNDFSGGQIDGALPFGRNSPDGFWNTHSGATSFSYDTKKIEFKTTISALNKHSFVNTLKTSDQFLNENTKYIANEDFERTTKTGKYLVSLKAKYYIDSTQEVALTSNYAPQTHNNTVDRLLNNANSNGQTISLGEQNTKTKKLNLPFSSKLNYRKKIGKTGALLGVFKLSNKINITDKNNIDNSQYYNLADTSSVNDFREIAEDVLRKNDMEKLSYSFSNFKKGILLLSARRNHLEDGNLLSNSLFDGSTYQRLDSLSGDYKRLVETYDFGVKQTINIGKTKLQLGVNYMTDALTGFDDDNQVLSNRYRFIAPRISWNIPFAGSKSLFLKYSTAQKLPNLRQVIPITDITSSMFTYLGNPDLIPTKSQSIKARYHSFNQFNGISFFSSITYKYQKNPIVTSQTTDPFLRRTSQPVNTPSDKSIDFYGHFGWKISALKLNMFIGGNGHLSNGFSVLNDRTIASERTRISGEFGIGNTRKKIYDINLKTKIGASHIKHQDSKQLNSSYLNYTFTGNFSVVLPKGFEFKTQGMLLYYPDSKLGKATQQPAVTWEILRRFGKGKKWLIGFSGFDLFERNIGINQRPTRYGVTTSQTDNVGRYFLGKVTYKI